MITQQIQSDLTDAMKAKDSLKAEVLKGLKSAFTNELVAQKKKPSDELGDEEAMSVLQRAAKQRKDSIEQFKKGGRDELADKEAQELAIIEAYLPEMMSKEDVEKVVKAKIDEMGISDKSQIGQLMGAVMKELKGKADGGVVKEVVSELL